MMGSSKKLWLNVVEKSAVLSASMMPLLHYRCIHSWVTQSEVKVGRHLVLLDIFLCHHLLSPCTIWLGVIIGVLKTC